MKVAILVPNFSEYSGDARVAELQAERFVEEGNEVAIFALDANIKLKNVDIFVLGMPKRLFLQRIYRLIFPLDFTKTIKWLPQLKDSDLIISHLYPMNWLAALAKKIYGVNYTYWYHGIPDPKLYPKLYERIYLHIFILLTRCTVKNVDRLVSVSNAARVEFSNYTGLESEVIYNHPDMKRFHEEIDGSEIRKKHNLGSDPVILNVGRVCPQKGAHLLIKAFNLILEYVPSAKLVIVGKHTYDYYLNDLKKQCGDAVIFAGYVSDAELPQYYSMCDIYATCSLWETYNIPLTEAQLCGKPVVAFDIGPHSEVIDKDGILVEERNIKQFAQSCITKLHEVRGDTVG